MRFPHGVRIAAALAAVVATALAVPGGAVATAAPILVQLRADAVCSPAAATLAAGGGTLVVPELRLWRVPAGARATVARLRREGAVSFSERERSYAVAATTTAAAEDPLVASEWWRAAVRVDTLTPPGPGVPVTVVDSGVSVGHPEFAGRPDFATLNPQEPAPLGGVHGTAVASVAAAPENGVGIVGIYPTAALRSYDVSLGDGTRLPSGEIAAGILSAARAGRSVINLSLGSDGRDAPIEAAVTEAVRRGSLVVAASGNSALEGNWISYPAASPHVLTVAATDRNDAVAAFSTQSQWVDLAAPGVDIPVASALSNDFGVESGTSFSSPLVAGAAAWIWTLRPTLQASQVAEILRRTARDVGAPGHDVASGFGVLDVAAALAAATPEPDLVEPNDLPATAGTATTRARPAGTVAGRVIAFEDPRDVLRVWLPAGRRVTVRATSDRGVALTLQRSTLASTDRLAVSRAAGTAATLTYVNRTAGRVAFLVVTPATGVRNAVFRVTVASAR
jgi:subtilisin family serine protease